MICIKCKIPDLTSMLKIKNIISKNKNDYKVYSCTLDIFNSVINIMYEKEMTIEYLNNEIENLTNDGLVSFSIIGLGNVKDEEDYD